MIRDVVAAIFGGAADHEAVLGRPLDPGLVAELDDETLCTAMLDASAADREVLWADIERRRLGA
jgi:hypothetical protein